MQKSTAYLVLSILTLSLLGCTTPHHLNDGVVISSKQLHENNYSPGDNAYNGLKFGGITGAVTGGTIGGVIGLVPGFMSASPPGLLICVATGSLVGATILGLTGCAIGGTVGYASDLIYQNSLKYEFKVKLIDESQTLIVTQHSSNIPLKTKVRILEKDGIVFIRKNN